MRNWSLGDNVWQDSTLHAKSRKKACPEVLISVHSTNKSKLWETGVYSKCAIPVFYVLSHKWMRNTEHYDCLSEVQQLLKKSEALSLCRLVKKLKLKWLFLFLELIGKIERIQFNREQMLLHTLEKHIIGRQEWIQFQGKGYSVPSLFMVCCLPEHAVSMQSR